MNMLALMILPIAMALPCAAPAREAGPQPWPSPPAITGPALPEFRPLPMRRVVAQVLERFEGRVVGLRVLPPRPAEARLGAALIYELRLLTPGRDALDIRVDARSGRMLEITGRDILRARRPACAACPD